MARNFKRVRLGEALVEDGFITEEALEQALQESKKKGQKLGEYFVESGIVIILSNISLATVILP